MVVSGDTSHNTLGTGLFPNAGTVLQKIGETTERDPRKLTDLLELIAATWIRAAAECAQTSAEVGSR